MKLIYLDCETTGLDPSKHDITQLAYIIEIDKKIIEEGNLRMKPMRPENASPKALEVTGTTLEGLAKNPEPIEQYGKFIKTLTKYIDQYNRADKFIWVGQNAPFDLGFVRAWFLGFGNKYFGSYFHYAAVDTCGLAAAAQLVGGVTFPNVKLGTLAEHYGIKLDAHDALNDVRATREVMYSLIGTIQGKKTADVR